MTQSRHLAASVRLGARERDHFGPHFGFCGYELAAAATDDSPESSSTNKQRPVSAI
jgi:hypothetical protein